MKPKPARWSAWFGPGAAAFAAIAATFGVLSWWLQGSDATLARVHAEFRFTLELAPMVAASLFMVGLLNQLLPRDRVTAWLGAESGWRGLMLATAAGILTPGGPFASFPIVVALYRAGADIGTTVAYLTGWSLIGLNRLLVWELPFLGPEFAWVRFAVSLPLSLLTGWMARFLIERGWPRPEIPGT